MHLNSFDVYLNYCMRYSELAWSVSGFTYEICSITLIIAEVGG